MLHPVCLFLAEISKSSVKKGTPGVYDVENHNKEKLAVTGTTCTMVLLTDNEIVVANLGDSRTVVYSVHNPRYVYML